MDNQITVNETPKRISGTGYDLTTRGGKAAVQHMKYSLIEGNTAQIDTKAIDTKLKQYIAEAEDKGKYSESGMCIALGVDRKTLRRWATGYVNQDDMQSDSVTSNTELCLVVRAQVLHIEKHWEECDNTGLSQKHVRLMETHGMIDGKYTQQPVILQQFNLGDLSKLAK